MIFVESNLAKQKQDQQNNNNKAEAAAPVVASAVKRAAADSTKAAQQCDHQDDENDSPKGHSRISLLWISRYRRLARDLGRYATIPHAAANFSESLPNFLRGLNRRKGPTTPGTITP